MALSGQFSGKTSNQYVKPTIIWSAVQDVAGNWSDVTVQLRYSRTNTGYTTQGNFSGALYIDRGLGSEQKATGSKSQLAVTYKSNTLAMEHTFRVQHDNNGSKRITISATGSIPPSSVESTTISQEVELDTIPRASGIGATDANIEASSMVVVTKKNSAFTHSIAYSFGSLSGYIKADGSVSGSEVKFSAGNVAFPLPADFYAQIPKAKSGVCTLTCKTYYGDTQIGDAQTAAFTATAAENLCAPTVSGTVADGNEATLALTGDENVLVRYHSSASCAITAAAKNSASLVSKTVNGKTIGSTLAIAGVESGSFTFTVKDSRGYSKSVKVTKTLVPYVKLTANASVKRTDPTSGNATLTVKGNFFSGSFGAAENELTLSYRVGSGQTVPLTPTISGNAYTATASLTGLSYDTAYPVVVTTADKLETVGANLTVAKGIPTFDWGEKDFQFHVPVSFNAGIEDRNVKTYSSLGQLGLSGGVTTDAVIAAMPEWSMLVFTNSGTSGNYLADAPTPYCIVVAHKSSVKYGTATATKVNSAAKEAYVYDWYRGGSYSGWTEQAKAADHKVKTYYAVSQLGLSGKPTTSEVLDAMPNRSILVHDNNTASDNNIGDIPTKYAQVVLYKGYSFGSGIATKSNATLKESYIYDWYSGGSNNAWTQVGKTVIKKVWTNSSPTSSFAGQTIDMDLSGYDMLIVHARLTTTTNHELPVVMPKIDGSAAVIYGVANGKIIRRPVNATADHITFADAADIGSYGSTSPTTNNAHCIPVVIYGVKGVA